MWHNKVRQPKIIHVILNWQDASKRTRKRVQQPFQIIYNTINYYERELRSNSNGAAIFFVLYIKRFAFLYVIKNSCLIKYQNICLKRKKNVHWFVCYYYTLPALITSTAHTNKRHTHVFPKHAITISRYILLSHINCS